MRAICLLPLALAACGQERPRLVLPPVERLAATAAPVPPSDATDENVARFIAAQDSALRTCNADKAFVARWIETAGKGN